LREASIIQDWIKEGKEEGLQQGMAKGMERGMEKGMEQGMEKGRLESLQEGILEVLEERFGAVPVKISRRLLQVGEVSVLRPLHRSSVKVADLAEFEALLDRVLLS
jgi:predicted transposase YdaD